MNSNANPLRHANPAHAVYEPLQDQMGSGGAPAGGMQHGALGNVVAYHRNSDGSISAVDADGSSAVVVPAP